jgi:hypothetical protein
MGCNEENKMGQENKRGLSPFLYFDYSGAEKSERWKKGACPLFYCPLFYFFYAAALFVMTFFSGPLSGLQGEHLFHIIYLYTLKS